MRRMPLGVRIRLCHPVENGSSGSGRETLAGVSRLQCFGTDAGPSCALAPTELFSYFMRQFASGYRPLFAHLTNYFDDDTFIRFQVYRSIYFSWPALQAAG